MSPDHERAFSLPCSPARSPENLDLGYHLRVPDLSIYDSDRLHSGLEETLDTGRSPAENGVPPPPSAGCDPSPPGPLVLLHGAVPWRAEPCPGVQLCSSWILEGRARGWERRLAVGLQPAPLTTPGQHLRDCGQSRPEASVPELTRADSCEA